MPSISWPALTAAERWMPIGRPEWTTKSGKRVPADPKAPAFGYRSNDPATWRPRSEIRTPMAGLNFGPADIIGIDLDFKPGELPEGVDPDFVRRWMADIEQQLPGPCEYSVSGNGRHIIAIADTDLREWLGGSARKSVRIVGGVVRYDAKGRKRQKDAAALEIMGGGNAYFALTENWVDGRAPDDAPLPVITLPMLQAALADVWPDDKPEPPRRPPRSPRPGGAAAAAGVDGELAPALPFARYALDLCDAYDPDAFKIIAAAKAAGLTADDVQAWWKAAGHGSDAFAMYQRADGRITAGTLIWYATQAGGESNRGTGNPIFTDFPQRPADLECAVVAYKTWGRRSTDCFGEVGYVKYECGRCGPCCEWRRRLIAMRYDGGGSERTTIATISGFAAPDVAATFVGSKGLAKDRAGRWRLPDAARGIDRDGDGWQATLVFQDPLAEADQVQLRERVEKVGYRLHILDDVAITGDTVAGDIIPVARRWYDTGEAWTDSKPEGARISYVQAWRFPNRWRQKAFRKPPTDHAYGDTEAVPADDAPPADTPMIGDSLTTLRRLYPDVEIRWSIIARIWTEKARPPSAAQWRSLSEAVATRQRPVMKAAAAMVQTATGLGCSKGAIIAAVAGQRAGDAVLREWLAQNAGGGG